MVKDTEREREGWGGGHSLIGVYSMSASEPKRKCTFIYNFRFVMAIRYNLGSNFSCAIYKMEFRWAQLHALI